MSVMADILSLLRDRLGSHAEAVVPFGSRVILPNYQKGDIDVAVILAAGRSGATLERGEIEKEMQKVRRALVVPDLENDDDTPMLEVEKSLPRARIPLLKMTHVPTKTAIDLVVHLGHPVVSSWFLRDIVAYSKTARELIPLVRQWAASKKITRADIGMLPKYGYSLLVVSFLQSKRILPSRLFVDNNENTVDAHKPKKARLEASCYLGAGRYYTEDELIRFAALDDRNRVVPWGKTLEALELDIDPQTDTNTLFLEFLEDLERKLSSNEPEPVVFRDADVKPLDEFADTSNDVFVLRDPITSRNVACVLTPTTKVVILNELTRATYVLEGGATVEESIGMKPLSSSAWR
ncbi:hypothetical protein FOL47_001893 [Perkinsus chesapeaki]|uniref:Uncharacterized protein n=1 Tax=Perkinsus chesapeaki TaxID=330153 RepID=A0A7J6MI02_PERCH|nr:hypothetical protein FOL47_001893 [Perkinsus chesapeaki]